MAKGWVGFDFPSAFGCPVKLINDAAMQALGSYKGGKLLFLGLGTGLGPAMVVNGQMLGDDRLIELAMASHCRGAANMADCILERVRAFGAGAQRDDLTLIMAELTS